MTQAEELKNVTTETAKSDVSVAFTGTIVADYYYDDPFETLLHGKLLIPPLPPGTPEFTVVGWKGMPEVVTGSPAYQAAQVWGTIAVALSYVMNLKQLPPYIKDWASTYNLVAIPRAGNQLNAYYDRSSLRFFCGKDPTNNRTIYTCDAVGIVAHELGHAILDSMRPDLWNTAVLEFFAFHEAFGDIISIASVLQHNVVIGQMIQETTALHEQIPNLWQSNVVSRLAEQLGHAIYYSSNMVMGAEKYLRNAFNDFKYIDSTLLPLGTSDTTLTQEPHNFSRIFSGAWYECFCKLFNVNYTKHDPVAVLVIVKEARDIMIRALLDAVLVAPSQLQFFQGVATTMVKVLTEQNKLKEAEIIKSVFIRRNLYNEVNASEPSRLESTIKIDPFSFPHHMRTNIGATISSPSVNISVELPKWVAPENNKDIYSMLSASIGSFVNYMSVQHLLGDEFDNNMFAVTKSGLLVRNYICSSFRALPQISSQKNIGNLAN